MAPKHPKEQASRNVLLVGLIGAVVFAGFALFQVVAGNWSARGCGTKGGAAAERSRATEDQDGHRRRRSRATPGTPSGRWNHEAPGQRPSDAPPEPSPPHDHGGTDHASAGGRNVILPAEGPRPGEEPPAQRMPGAIRAPDLYRTVRRDERPMVPPPPPAPRSADEALGVPSDSP